jgi:UDP:flavonoid glycosyltransferase YjiC (YdhE family)
MHILISATGSYGDVYPFVGLASVLHRRGHEVVFCTNEHFRAAAEAEGLEFVGVGSAALYEEAVNHPDLWHPTRGTRVVLGTVAQYAPLAYEALRQLYRAGETLLVASTISLERGCDSLAERVDSRGRSMHFALNWASSLRGGCSRTGSIHRIA